MCAYVDDKRDDALLMAWWCALQEGGLRRGCDSVHVWVEMDEPITKQKRSDARLGFLQTFRCAREKGKDNILEEKERLSVRTPRMSSTT